MPKPHRLPAWSYRGIVSVFVTCVTHGRQTAFADPSVCEFVLADLFANCDGSIEITAHCMMPDHGHFLLTALRDRSEIPRTIRRWKQATGYCYSTKNNRKLWQKNYWDYVLRDPDDQLAVALYAISDPKRSGLVESLQDYPWWGSQRWTREELARLVIDFTFGPDRVHVVR